MHAYTRIYTQTCSYNDNYGMIPFVRWGDTPESEKAWHKSNDCDTVMGGQQLLNCPYICSANSGNKIVSEHFFLKPYALNSILLC